MDYQDLSRGFGSKSSGRGTYSSKRNPCPICQKDHGCLISHSGRVVTCIRADSQWTINGWEYKKQARGGMGSVWGIDSGNQNKTEYRPQIEKTTKPSNLKPLTDEQLDTEARKIQKQLGLNTRHRQSLRGRGLSDSQIDSIGSVSVDKFQELNLIPINPSFPGMGDRGTLTNGDSGFIVFTRNIKGQITGGQVATDHRGELDKKGKEIPKYPWLTGCSERRVSKERPLQFLKLNNSRILDIIEGTLKPLIAAHLHNINVLGSGGTAWHGSPNEFKGVIDSGLFDTYILNPDTGCKFNHHVMYDYRESFLFLKKHEITLYVRDWGQGDRPKSDKIDVDEIDTQTFNNARIIPYTEWDSEYTKAEEKAREEWVRKRDYAARLAWIKNKKYTPDIIYDEPFCVSPKAPKKDEIVLICYGTSQGKSTRIKCWFNNELKDLGAIKFGSRNSLEIQFAATSDFYHLREDDGHHLIKDPRGRLTLCIDSILKFDDEDFENKVIVLDEIESVARHILYGGTLKERQQQVIDKFKIALQRCHSIILADGNLTDATCEWIRKISGKRLIKYYNKRLATRPECWLYKNVGSDFKKIAHQIKSEAFPWAMLDSQVDCETLDKDLSRYGRKPLRIDSKTINDPILGKEIKRFLSDPDGFLLENEKTKTYDCIISSPTVESGLDCNYSGFSGVYLLAKHLEINTLMQMIIRVRDITVPRHICCPEFVKPSDDSVVRSPFNKTLQRIEIDLQKASVEALGTELGQNKDDLLKALHRIVDDAFNTPENDLFNVFQAIRNYEHSNYQECFVESLENSGYKVNIVDLEKPILTQFKECKKEVKQEKAKDICDAQKIDDKQFKALSKRQDLKWEDRCSVIKYKFLERLPGVEFLGWDKDFVYHLLFENKKLINQAEIRWLLNHPELAVKRSEKAWHGVVKNNRTFLGNFKTLLPLIKELNRLGVPKMLEKFTRTHYNSNTPEVRRLWEEWGRVQVSRTGIERGASPMRLMTRLASKLGYDPVEQGRTEKERDNILNDLLLDPYGLIVSQCVDERLENENLEPRLTDSDWIEILQRETLESNQRKRYRDDKLTYSYISNNKSICHPCNAYVEDITAIPTVKNTQNSEPMPEPVKTDPITPEPEPQNPQIDPPKVGQKFRFWSAVADGWTVKTVKQVVQAKIPSVTFTDGSWHWLESLTDTSRWQPLTDFSDGVNIREGFTG